MLTIIGYLFILGGAICSIIILIAAFQDELWKGIVGLLCGLYLLYFGIVEFQSPNKWPIVAGAFFGGSIGGLLIRLGGQATRSF